MFLTSRFDGDKEKKESLSRPNKCWHSEFSSQADERFLGRTRLEDEPLCRKSNLEPITKRYKWPSIVPSSPRKKSAEFAIGRRIFFRGDVANLVQQLKTQKKEWKKNKKERMP